MTPPPAAGTTDRTVAPGRRPVGPRRISGPSRRSLPTPSPPVTRRPLLVPRHGVSRLVDHPLLDRLIRGRTWIGIVAVALIGIVAMQVVLLDLNAGIGRSVQRTASLTRTNALLSVAVSTLRARELSQADATHQGMIYAPPGDVRYLTAGTGDAARAASTMAAPRLLGTGAASGSSIQSAPTLGSAPSGQVIQGPGTLSTASGQSSSTGAATASGGATQDGPQATGARTDSQLTGTSVSAAGATAAISPQSGGATGAALAGAGH